MIQTDLYTHHHVDRFKLLLNSFPPSMPAVNHTNAIITVSSVAIKTTLAHERPVNSENETEMKCNRDEIKILQTGINEPQQIERRVFSCFCRLKITNTRFETIFNAQ